MFYQDHLTVRSNLKVLNQVQKWFEKFWLRHNLHLIYCDHSQDYQLPRLNLALAEGFTNAVRHAHSGLSPETSIEIEVLVRDSCIEIRIWDWGQPFDPNCVEEPEPGTLREGGYGWFLLRRLADRVSYDRQGQRNCLHIIKEMGNIAVPKARMPEMLGPSVYPSASHLQSNQPAALHYSTQMESTQVNASRVSACSRR